MPGAWKTVRVFISSTFRDMHGGGTHTLRSYDAPSADDEVRHPVSIQKRRSRFVATRIRYSAVDLRSSIGAISRERTRAAER